MENFNPIEEGHSTCLHEKEKMLTSKEAAAYIEVSMGQLYHLTSSKRIPFCNPTGGRLYFKKSELDHWMISGGSMPVQVFVKYLLPDDNRNF